jgi:hypothetical protein
VLLLVLSLGCRKRNSDCSNTPQYQQLTTSAKEWFPYNSNRILIFENASLQKDTLELKNYFSGDDEVWGGDECPVTKGQFLRGDIVDKTSGDTIKAQVGYGEQVLLQKKNSYVLFYDTKSVLILASNYRRLESSINLNNKTYSLVLVYECSPNDNCITTGITKFYFAKTKGIVAFERNNILWTLK